MSTSPEIASPPQKPLREMSGAEFEATYGVDRFTASVIRNRLNYAVEHMSTGFLREAFSPIIRDWYDFACTISGPPALDYPMSVVSNSLVVFLGTMGDGVRNAVVEFGPENLSPGDVLICNDPYRLGTHVNDILFIRPVFHQGEIVSFINLRAHQIDMGGIAPGGFSSTKANVYENGLVIAPMLLYSGDQPIRSSFSLIFDNSRFGEILLPDLKSIYQQLKLGERLMEENIERYGIDNYLGTLRYAVDSSAERMSEALASIPDGDYVGTGLVDADGMDASEEYDVKVTLHVRGDRIEADLSGTSRQARTCINATILDAKTAIGVGLTMLLDPETPFTTGTWRNVDIVCPEGSIFSSMPPEGAIMMPGVHFSLMTAVFAALNPVLGESAVAGDYGDISVHNGIGVLPDGTPWANVAQCGGEHGPWGATKEGDGDSYNVLYMLNNLDPATEAIEHDAPVVVLRKEAAIDTGGAGYNRGGASCIRDSLWLHSGEHWSSPFHTKRPTGIGAYGARDGALGAVWLFPDAMEGIERLGEPLVADDDSVYSDSTPVAGMLDPERKSVDPDGRYFHFASQASWKTKPGAMFRYLTNGGGGWGDPRSREPERVLRDVRDGYVSVSAARAEYGVVVLGDPEFDPEGISVDPKATAALRRDFVGC